MTVLVEQLMVGLHGRVIRTDRP